MDARIFSSFKVPDLTHLLYLSLKVRMKVFVDGSRGDRLKIHPPPPRPPHRFGGSANCRPRAHARVNRVIIVPMDSVSQRSAVRL